MERALSVALEREGAKDGMKWRFRRTRMARLGIERIATTGAIATRTKMAGRASIPAKNKRRWWFMVKASTWHEAKRVFGKVPGGDQNAREIHFLFRNSSNPPAPPPTRNSIIFVHNHISS